MGDRRSLYNQNESKVGKEESDGMAAHVLSPT